MDEHRTDSVTAGPWISGTSSFLSSRTTYILCWAFFRMKSENPTSDPGRWLASWMLWGVIKSTIICGWSSVSNFKSSSLEWWVTNWYLAVVVQRNTRCYIIPAPALPSPSHLCIFSRCFGEDTCITIPDIDAVVMVLQPSEPRITISGVERLTRPASDLKATGGIVLFQDLHIVSTVTKADTTTHRTGIVTPSLCNCWSTRGTQVTWFTGRAGWDQVQMLSGGLLKAKQNVLKVFKVKWSL